MTVLKPHQQAVVDMNPSRALIPDGTGTGKTLIGIALADKNCKTCLVITIKDNVEKWMREVDEHSNQNCTYKILSKEHFKREWYVLPRYDGIIVDECHHFAGSQSMMSKMLGLYLKKHDVVYRWLMSATPVTANWESVRVLANHLGNNISWYAFRRFFFYEMRLGPRTVWQKNPAKEQQLMELVRRLAHGRMVTMDDIVEVPDQTFVTEYFELTPEQTKAIEELGDSEHIVRWTKTHQIENGTLAGNEYEEAKDYPCLKNDRIMELAKKSKKIAVFCRYNHQLETLAWLLRDLKRPIFIINGATNHRDAVVQSVEASKDAIVLINSSCGTGYELPSIGTIIFASLSFSYLDYEQGKGRFLRVNKLKENTYYHLVTKGGVDEGVYQCINEKRDFYLELFNKN